MFALMMRCRTGTRYLYGDAWHDVMTTFTVSGTTPKMKRTRRPFAWRPAALTVNASACGSAPGTNVSRNPTPLQQQLRGLRACRHAAGEKEKP
jgi:hypothetical protein